MQSGNELPIIAVHKMANDTTGCCDGVFKWSRGAWYDTFQPDPPFSNMV